MSVFRLLVSGHFFGSPARFGDLPFLDSLSLSRGLGRAAIALAFTLLCRCSRCRADLLVLIGRITTSMGCDEAVSAAGRRPVRSILSAAVRVSGTIPEVAIAGSVMPSSGGEIDAVTLLAQRPARQARQKAASQTVLIISTPTSEARQRGLTKLPKSEIYQP
jgi:hypothetical protein